MMTVDEVLSTTRAVRRRLDFERAVPLAVVTECLRLAVQAPTGGNRQNWRWLVLTDAGRRRAFAELYREVTLRGYARALEAAPDEGARRAYQGAIDLAEMLERVPVIVIPCTLGRPDLPGGSGLPGFFGSIIPAVWSFQLALRSRGLGSTFVTSHLYQEDRFARLLGIPDDVTQVAMLPVAYTIGDTFSPAARRPIHEVTYLDHWGAEIAAAI
jgi:nitroreductase